MLKILIADDSLTDTAILKSIFESEPDMTVIGCAQDGVQAVEMVERYKPDIVTMDIKMPKMNGYEAIEAIMTQCPTPIIVISSMVSDNEADATFRALEAGALTVLPKPINILSKKFMFDKRHMLDTIRSMSQIQMIRKRNLAHKAPFDHLSHTHQREYQLIAIGSSIGGPQALKDIFSRLPTNFPLPIVAVQHMTVGFIGGFTKWLNSHVDLNIKCAEEGELLLPGFVYFAPDNVHFGVRKINNTFIATLTPGSPVAGFCPSITALMQSVAAQCGHQSVGILLTGMGSDGAEGLLAIKNASGHTLIQDQASSVVFGMANVAHSLGAVNKIVELDKIAEYLIKITNNKKSKP